MAGCTTDGDRCSSRASKRPEREHAEYPLLEGGHIADRGCESYTMNSLPALLSYIRRKCFRGKLLAEYFAM